MTDKMRIFVEGKENAAIVASTITQEHEAHIHYQRAYHGCEMCFCSLCESVRAGIDVCEVADASVTSYKDCKEKPENMYMLFVKSTTTIGGEGESDEQ